MSPEQIRRMSDGELYTWMGMDAERWALAFCAKNPAADHELMRTWFASAIMAGYDRGQPINADHIDFLRGSREPE
mgnify:CR=1 FL=1